MNVRGPQRSADHRRFWGSDREGARQVQERPAAVSLKLTPVCECGLYERDVGGVFVIGGANDAGFAVTRSPVVPWRELLDADNAHPSPGQAP